MELPKRQFELLVKVMMLTTSQSDGESLNAMRKANSILNNHKLNWEEILTKSVIVKDEPVYQPPPKRGNKGKVSGDSAHILFCELAATGRFTYSRFVKSCEEFYQKTGFLTEKQYWSLKKLLEDDF